MLRTTLSKSLYRLSTGSVVRSAATILPTTVRSQISQSWRSPLNNNSNNNVFRNTGSSIRFYSDGPAPLTNEFVSERIIGILQCYDKVSESASLTPETSFTSDLGLDSFDVVEVVLAIEEEFNILIPDQEADEIKTIGQAVEYILKQPDAL